MGVVGGVGRGHERDSGWSIAAGGFRGLPLLRGHPGQPSSVFLKAGFLCVGGWGGGQLPPPATPTTIPKAAQDARLPSLPPFGRSSPSERGETRLAAFTAGEPRVGFHQPRRPKIVSLLALMHQLAPSPETTKPIELHSLLKNDQYVVFAFIVVPSRDARAKVVADR